jgi:hypothetical protein
VRRPLQPLLATAALASLLAGCISIDRRAGRECIDPAATAALHATFATKALYASPHKRPFSPPALSDDLGEVLGTGHSPGDRAHLSRDPAGEVTITWLQGADEVRSQAFSGESALSLAADGSLEFAKATQVLPLGSAAGRITTRRRVFVTDQGSLVVVVATSEWDAGILGIVPLVLWSHAKQVAVFPRAE